MNLFNYLMAKKGHNTSVRDDLFAYLLGKKTSREVKTATGTTISISDVTSTKIVSLTLSKESTQDGTPTPENPVEVKTVKGYRNLLNLSDFSTQTISGITLTKNSDNSITINGTSTSAITLDIPITDINLETEKTYRIYQNNIFTGANYAISLRDSTRNIIDTSCSLDSATSSKTFTVASNKIAKYFRIFIVTGKTINTTIYPMIIESTQELAYVPYGNNYVNVNLIGKNLFNRYDSNIINGRLDGNGNVVSSASWRTVYINAKPNTQYTISGVTTANGAVSECIYDENMSFISSPGKYKNQTFTTPANAKYLGISVDIIDLDKFQIEEGSTATSYEPYKESIVTIPLNNNEIVGIGEYEDELIVDKNGKCWLNKKTAKIDSYNGETITTNYMSTTGGLDTGATVYYVLETPQLIDLNYTVDLTLFEGVNNISNSEDMDMILKYY